MLKSTVLIVLLFGAMHSSVQGHFLWKIDGEKPSYLVGTVHSSDPSVRNIPPPVLEALERSSTYHPELEFSPENLGKLTAAMFASGEDLEKELPPELWRRVAREGEKLGLPRALLRRVPLQLAPMIFATPPGADFDKVLDIQLYRRALEGGLDIQQLESVDEQISVFRSLPRATAVSFIEEALAEAEKGHPSLQKTLQLYSRGDLQGLETFLREEFERYKIPGLEEALLLRRNQLMYERLQPFLRDGGAFVAVGVGHLPGEGGLISLLRDSGLTVRRIELREPEAAP